MSKKKLSLTVFLLITIYSLKVSAQSRCMDVSNLLQRDQMNRLIDRTFKALVKSGNCADQEKEGNPEDQQLPPDTIKVPPRIKNIPLTVNLSLYIEQLSQIMDLEMTFRIDFYIVQRWTAQRIYCNLYKKLLSERNIRLSDYNSSGDMLQMNSDFFKFFWLPDSYIANAKSTEMQSATLSTRSLQVYVTPNTKSYGGDGVGGGEVCQMLLSGRYAAIIPCYMNFRDFPVDTQMCNFSIKSFSFPVDEVILSWQHQPSIERLQLPQHTCRLYAKTATFVAPLARHLFLNSTEEKIPAEYKYTQLVVTLILSRDISNKLAGVYVPTALIVLVCLSSFWYGPRSITDRITVGTTALLALITQFIDTRKYLPPISYISEIDIWMIMCMVFVCIQLVQGTFVHYYYIQAKRDRKRKQERREQQLRERMQQEKTLAQSQPSWLKPVSYTPPSSCSSPALAAMNESNAIMPRNRFDWNRTGATAKLQFEANTSNWNSTLPLNSNVDDQSYVNGSSSSSPRSKANVHPFWQTSYGKLYWKVFGTDVPTTSSAYVPELIDTHSRFWILFAFAVFCIGYWSNIGKLISQNSLEKK